MILAIDTATRNVSLAVYDGQQVLAEMTWQSADHHTVELAPALQNMLRLIRVVPGNLTALAVTIGPGSYTGLRIGMSLAKGLALAGMPPLPVVGVLTLDVIAAAQPHQADRLYAVAQAGRGRINVALYHWDGTRWQGNETPFITTWEGLAGRLTEPAQIAGEMTARGREVLSALDGLAIVAGAAQGLRRAGFLAELAWDRLRAGTADDPARLAPLYLT